MSGTLRIIGASGQPATLEACITAGIEAAAAPTYLDGVETKLDTLDGSVDAVTAAVNAKLAPATFITPATATNATATVTKAAPGAGLSHYITGVWASVNILPSVAVFTAVLAVDGATVLTIDIQGVAYVPFSRPFKATEDKAVTLVCTTGAAQTCNIALMGYTAA